MFVHAYVHMHLVFEKMIQVFLLSSWGTLYNTTGREILDSLIFRFTVEHAKRVENCRILYHISKTNSPID